MKPTRIQSIIAALAVLAAGCASALLAAPAHAEQEACKPAATRYIHSGDLPNGDLWTYWWCADGTLQWIIARPSLATPANRAAALAYWSGLVDGSSAPAPDTPPADDVAAAWRVVWPLIAADKDRPAGFVVARNGSSATRPAYPVDDKGVRGTKSTARATVGATCDCATKVVDGSTTYCGIAPKLVAVCTKAP